MPVQVICETCGNSFNVPPSRFKHSQPRFCSPTCFYAWLEKYERAEYLDVNCQSCGKPIHILASRYRDGRGRFCSQECMIAARPDPIRTVAKLQRICKHCGKVFERYPSQLKRARDGKFCCRPCAAAYGVRRMRLATRPSSIERLLMQELDARGAQYVSEFPLTGWNIDIAFPAQRLAVEADGDYWHSLENVIEKDARKDAALAAAGWTVLHFTESEINASPAHCVDQILTYLT